MNQIRYLIIVLLCAMVQGAWAQTEVSTESELNSAINAKSKSDIKLTANITLTNYVEITEGKTVTIDLNGYKIDRGLSEMTSYGNVIRVATDGTLTIKDNSEKGGGKITGGYDYCGGGICIYGTVTIEGGTISGCNGKNGGAIYLVSGGTLYFKGGTIKDCYATENGGGIRVPSGATLDISGGEITGNTAKLKGGGVYCAGTIYAEGNPVIKDNSEDNLYLDGSDIKLYVGDPFKTGASIGVSLSDYDRLFTSGFRLNNEDAVPSDYFTPDVDGVDLDYEDGEAKLSGNVAEYVERSWSGGNTDGSVVSTAKKCTNFSTLGKDAETLSGGWYLLSGTVEVSKRVQINGKVRFILEDGCKYTFKKGIYIVKGKTLYIYGQTNDSGQLIITDGEDQSAIGGNKDGVGGNLEIHGGYVKAHANDKNFAGIGGGDGSSSGMQSVTIYGGEVSAHGESSAAGIGGGQQNDNSNHPVVKIYGGKVTADSEDYGAGIGGGEDRSGCEVYIWGGEINATGGSKGAGIGGGQEGSGNTFVMYGGTVTATGGKDGAGVGGGHEQSGGIILLYGGTLKAEGKDGAYAIGSGDDNSGNNMTLTLGSTVCVKDANGNLVGKDSRKSTLNSAKKATVMTCTHDGCSVSQKDDYYHHYDCSYCEGEDEAHTRGADGKCTVCEAGLPSYTWTFYESNQQGTAYQSKGTEYSVKEDSEFTFPDCGTVPDGMIFAGWERKAEDPGSVTVTSKDGLTAAGETITVESESGNRNYYARYIETSISGSGTEADPLVISTTDDLNDISSMVSKGDDLSGYYIKLDADIAYDKGTENNFTPIGSSTTNFNGTFDGQGYTISGLNISASGSTYQGLFGFIGEEGVVKNLTLDNSTITGGDNSGGFSGKNLGTIENCVAGNSLEVTNSTSKTNIGAFAGYNSGKISGCVSKASVGGSKSKKSGGIVGYTVGTVEYCLYLGGSVNGSNYIGSIAGNKGTAATFTKNYYVPTKDQPNGVGSNKQNDDVSGAEAGYTVTCSTSDATLDFGTEEASFKYSGIKAYSSGLLYDGALYTGGEAEANFTVSTNDNKTVSNVSSDTGTLTSNTDGSYTLTMNKDNAVVTVELADMTTITLTDGTDNTSTLEENDGQTVNVDYDRELSAGESASARTRQTVNIGTAYTVCLPYDFDVDEQAYTDSIAIDEYFNNLGNEEAAARSVVMSSPAEYAFARVFTLAAIDKDNKQFIFTDAPSFIQAGTPAVIVIYNGSINLSAKGVRINSMLSTMGEYVYPSYADYKAQGKNYLGYWKGSFETLRASFVALDDTEVGSYKPMYLSENGELQAFPADIFADDLANGNATGIMEVKNGEVRSEKWYSIDGRMLNGKPTQKGIYINNGKKAVVK